ncbi:uncharacterized protein LODBEIA_P03460 [Lodderomyces beijingensis]|uniref:Amino acid permease/ SLC12A domain-containing protein n=1 Tax=Lodderomyces beijingensis TaxID=1775926 RepID=A0ABP0ZIW5_9ASCO
MAASDHSDDESSIQHNGLFPSLNHGHGLKKQADDSDNDDEEGDEEKEQEQEAEDSINELRNTFKKNTSHHIDLEEVDLSELSSQTLESVQASEDDVSLDSSIINNMADDVNVGADASEQGKFKFVRMYERTVKQTKREKSAHGIIDLMKTDGDIPLQTLNSSESSVFELSKLHDFDRFVKETALNDRISRRVSMRKLNVPDNNTLLLVNEQDLAGRFYAGNEASTAEIRKKNWVKQHPKRDTKNKLHEHEHEHVVQSDLSGLYFPMSSSTGGGKESEAARLHRGLSVRHLQMISLGGTIGVGLFLNSGKAINIAGGLGALLAFIFVGLVVLATLLSFAEMVTFGVAGEVVAGVIMLSYFSELKTAVSRGSATGFVTLFLTSIIVSNLIDVRVYGEIEYLSSLIKLLWAVVMMIAMIVLNRGGFGGPVLGFRYWDYSKSDFESNIIFGPFRASFNLHDSGTSPPSQGIGGNLGRFLSLLTAVLVVCYAYSGTEIVCIAACEAKNPRKALPSATRRVFWRIVIFYCLSTFLVSLNIYAGDPRILRYQSGLTGIKSDEFATNVAIQAVGGVHCNAESMVFAGYGSGAQSPWVVALQSAGACKFSTAANVFLVFFAVSCGNAQLYVSSRTIYSLALQKKVPKFLTYCSRNGIPYNAVLLASSFGFLSYTCVSQSATNVFQNLTSVIASSGIFVWFAMCLTFIRFYYGLKRRPDIMGRDDKFYPFKSPLQPYTAIFGMVSTAIIMLAMGFVVFLKDEWDTMFFFASYGPLMTFAALYVGYRLIKGTTTPSLDRLDFDSGRTEMDRYIWDGGNEYNRRSFKEVLSKWLSYFT